MRKDEDRKFERQFSNSNLTMNENTKTLFAKKPKRSKIPKRLASVNPFDDDEASLNKVRYPSFIVPDGTHQKGPMVARNKGKNKKKQSIPKQLQIMVKPTFSEHELKKFDEEIDDTIIEIIKYQNIMEDPIRLDYDESEELIRCHSLMSATTEPLLPPIEPINITPIKKKPQNLSYSVNYKWISKQASILKAPNKEKTNIFVSGSQYSIHTIMKSLLSRAVTLKPTDPKKMPRIYDIDSGSSETSLQDNLKERGIMTGISTKRFVDKSIMVGTPNCTADCNRSIMVGTSVLIEGNRADQSTNTEDPKASKRIQTISTISATHNAVVYNTHSKIFTIFHMAKESSKRDLKVKKLVHHQCVEKPEHDDHEENSGQDHQAIEKAKSATEKLDKLKTIANKPYHGHIHRHMGDGDVHIFKNIEVIAYPLMKYTFKPPPGFCGMEDRVSSDSDDQSTKEKRKTEGSKSPKRIPVDRKTAVQQRQPKPMEPKPMEPKLMEPKPMEPKPMEPKPMEPKPMEPKPMEPKPMKPKPQVKDVKPKREACRPKRFPVKKVIEKPHQNQTKTCAGRLKQASPVAETKYLKIQDDVFDLIKKLPIKIPPRPPRKPTPPASSSSRPQQNRKPPERAPWRNTTSLNKLPLVKAKPCADRDNQPIIAGFEKDMKTCRALIRKPEESVYKPRSSSRSPKRRPTSAKNENSDTIRTTQSMISPPIEESKLLGKICSARDNLTKYTVQSMDLLKPMIDGGKLPSIEGLLDDYLMKSGELQTSNQNLMSVLMQQLCLNYELNRHLDATIKRINNGTNADEYKLERPDLQNLMTDAELISKPEKKDVEAIEEITVDDTTKTEQKRTKKSLKHQKQKAEILEFCQVLRQLRKEDAEQESNEVRVKMEVDAVVSPQQSTKLATEDMEEKILERLEPKPENSREEIMTKHLKLMARKLKESGIIHIDSLEDELDGLVEKYYQAKSENSLESSTLKNVSSCFSDVQMKEEHEKKVEGHKPLNVQSILREMTAMVKTNLKEAMESKAPEASIQELLDIEAILAHHEKNIKNLHVGRKVHDNLPVTCKQLLHAKKKPIQANSTIPVIHVNENAKKIPQKADEPIGVLHLLNTQSFTSTSTVNSIANPLSEIFLQDITDDKPLQKKNCIHCSKSDNMNPSKKGSSHSQSTLRAVSSLTSKLTHPPQNFTKKEENTSNDVPSLDNSDKAIASLKVAIEPCSTHHEKKIMEIAAKEGSIPLAKVETKRKLRRKSSYKVETKIAEDVTPLEETGTKNNLHEMGHKDPKIIPIELPPKRSNTKTNLHDVLVKMDHEKANLVQDEIPLKKTDTDRKLDDILTKMDQEETEVVEDETPVEKTGTKWKLHDILTKMEKEEPEVLQNETPVKNIDTKRKLHDILAKMNKEETEVVEDETPVEETGTKWKLHDILTNTDKEETDVLQNETPVKNIDTKRKLHDILRKMDKEETEVVQDETSVGQTDTKRKLHDILPKLDKEETEVVEDKTPLKRSDTKMNLNKTLLANKDQKETEVVHDETPSCKWILQEILLTKIGQKTPEVVQDEAPLKRTDTKTSLHAVLTKMEDGVSLKKTSTIKNLLEVEAIKENKENREEAKSPVEKPIVREEEAPLVNMINPPLKKKAIRRKKMHEASTMMDETDIHGLIVAKAEMEPQYAKILMEVINAMDEKDDNTITSNEEVLLSIEDIVPGQRPKKLAVKHTDEAIEGLLTTSGNHETKILASSSILHEDITQRVQPAHTQYTSDDYASLTPSGGYADKWLKRTSRSRKLGYSSPSKRAEEDNIMATKLKNLIDLETDKGYSQTLKYGEGNHDGGDDLKVKQPKVSRLTQVQSVANMVTNREKKRTRTMITQKTRITKDTGTVMDGSKGVIQRKHLEISTSKLNRYLVPEVLVEFSTIPQVTVSKGNTTIGVISKTKVNTKRNTNGNTRGNTKGNTKGVTIREIHEACSIEKVASEPVTSRPAISRPVLKYPKSNDLLISAKMKKIQEFFGIIPLRQIEASPQNETKPIVQVKTKDDLPIPREELKKSDDVLMEEFKARTIKSVIESIIHEMSTREAPRITREVPPARAPTIAKLNSVDKNTNTKILSSPDLPKPGNLQIETRTNGVDFNLPADCQKMGAKFNVFYNFPKEEAVGKWPNRISYKLVEDRVNDEGSYLTESLTFVKRTKLDGRSRMYFEDRQQKAEELRGTRFDKIRPRRSEFKGKTKEEILQEGIDRYKTLYGFGPKPMSADQRRQKVKTKLEDGNRRVHSACAASSSQRTEKRKVTKEETATRDEVLKNGQQGKARTRLPRPILKRQDCAVKIRTTKQPSHHTAPTKLEAKLAQSKVCFKKDQGMAAYNTQTYLKPIYTKQLPTKQYPIKQLPTRPLPTRQLPTRQLPTRQLPTRIFPTRQLPTRQLPTRQLPTRQFPTRQLPIRLNPVKQLPINQLPIRQVPMRQFKPRKNDGTPIEKINRSKDEENVELIEEIHVGRSMIDEADDSSSSSEISADSGWTEMVKIGANKKIKIYRVKDDGTTCILENLFDKALGRDEHKHRKRSVDRKYLTDGKQSNKKPFWYQLDGYPLSCDPGYPFSYPAKRKEDARKKKGHQIHHAFTSEAIGQRSLPQASNSCAVAETKITKTEGRIWTRFKDTPHGRLIVNSIHKIKVPYLRFWRSDNL